jgi:S-layer protein
MDFSTNTSGAGLVTGISTIDLQDVSGYSNAITIAGTNTTNTSTPVTISFAPSTASGFTTIGGMTVAKTGGTQSDVVNLSLGANAASVASGGTFTATTIETLNITSARASTGTLTLGNITLTDGPGTQVVNLTAASTVAAGTITADTVNFSGVTGAVTGVTLANTAGVSFVGGSGNTVVVGSSSADLITTGAGNDTITPAGGADVITTGAGNDRVNFTASVATVIVAPVISDFTVGTTTTVTDSIAINTAITTYGAGAALASGAGAAASLTATALGSVVVQSVATNAAAAAVTAGAGVIKLTSTTAGTGATAQAVFNAAIGSSTVIGLTASTEHLVLAYDATAGRALVLDVTVTATTNTTLETGDSVTVIGSITMTAADYANFGANNILAY